MIFTEHRFLLFFAVVFAVHWVLGGERERKVWLLCCSYFFYAAWDWRFLSLIGVSTLVDYVAGLRIASAGAGTRPARRWLSFSVIFNLSLLGVFKYFHFFTDSAVAFLHALGFGASPPALAIILPVGISFYTFQTMSYSIDIYRGRLKPTRDLADLALFVGFFPQLVAGPIVRARNFIPQLHERHILGDVKFRRWILLFLVGYFKKSCVSDNISPVVDAFYARPEAYDALSAWIASTFYSIQIYCDFSGYSDMAIACAGLLGYRLGVNFAFPYFAPNIREFWRRWHISLSTWLRDYLYIPLGGGRGGRLFRSRNLMLTMLLGGLWHGAAWHFVIWGGLHGIALAVHREWDRLWTGRERLRRTLIVPATLLTFWWANLVFIVFRATDTRSAWSAVRSYVTLHGAGVERLDPALLWIPAVLVPLHFLAYKGADARLPERLPAPLCALIIGGFIAIIAAFVPTDIRPFIYFQF